MWSAARSVLGRLRRRVRAGRTTGRESSRPAGPTTFQRDLAPFRAVLPSRSKRTVVVLTAEAGADCRQLIGQEFTDDHVFVIGVDPGRGSSFTSVALTEPSLSSVEDALVRIGPIDILLQHRPLVLPDQAQAVRRLLFQLRRKGVYLVDRAADVEEEDRSWSDLAELLDPGDRAASTAARSPVDQEFGKAVGTVVWAPGLLLVTKATTHHLKLREAEVDELLRLRRGVRAPKVLAERPGGSFRSRTTVRHYGVSAPPRDFDPVFHYPPMLLRRYPGKISLISHSLLCADHSLLPSSFRHHLSHTLTHDRAVDANERFARIPVKYRPRATMAGSFFHADAPYPGHFGHVMTEVVSRLWAWREAKAACPELRAIYRLSTRPDRALVDRQMLEGFGIAADDIVSVDAPVFLDGIYSATQMWHNQRPHYVHPEILELWGELRRNLRTPVPLEPARRIFVSRPASLHARACRNTPEVEQFFASRGFRVIYPEHYSLSDQATIFGAAEVVAGFAGSALLNTMFSADLRSLIVLGHHGYTARNEYLVASLLGCELDYLWSEPDVAHPPKRWSAEGFASPWAFDFVRHGRDLDLITAR